MSTMAHLLDLLLDHEAEVMHTLETAIDNKNEFEASFWRNELAWLRSSIKVTEERLATAFEKETP